MTRNEATAGGILTVLALLVVAGWWTTPGRSGTAAGTVNPAPIPPRGDDTLAYRAVTASDNTGAVTALILGFMIGGAAMIGLFCCSPASPGLQRAAMCREIPDPCRRSVTPPTLGVPDELPGSARNQLLRLRNENGGLAAARPPFHHSSIAPGAVLETVIRNSMLDLVFFNRSIIKSMA